jgi:hypothetical protein
MNILEIITEANVAAKLKDANIIRQLVTAMNHDKTLPKSAVAKLGPRPTQSDVVELWSAILDRALSNTSYGNVSQDGKFDQWLTKLYYQGVVDFEEIDGEGGDALGAWKALSKRRLLSQEHQDFNVFKNLKQIQRIVGDNKYRDELRRIKDSAELEQHKRDKKESVIVDTPKYLAIIPYNYGSCYTFNNSIGKIASFCTGSSSGLRWFTRYAPDGPIVSIIDKENPDDKNGKWQFHAPTNQLVNADQDDRYSVPRNDARFAKLFPGLMKSIVAGIAAHADEIKKGSKDLTHGGYDIARSIEQIKSEYPISYASVAPTDNQSDQTGQQTLEPPEDQPAITAPAVPNGTQVDQGPGVYRASNANGNSREFTGDNLEDIRAQLQARYPNSNIDTLNIAWIRGSNDAPAQ